MLLPCIEQRLLLGPTSPTRSWGVLTAYLHPANPSTPSPDSSHHSFGSSMQFRRYTFLVSLVRSICKAFGRFMTQRPSSVSWRPPAGPRITGTCIHNNHMPGTGGYGVLWQMVQERGFWCDSWVQSAHCLVGIVVGAPFTSAIRSIQTSFRGLWQPCHVTPLFGTLLSPLFTVSQSFGCSVPSLIPLNGHWCVLCFVPGM